MDVPAVRAGEDLDEFGDQSPAAVPQVMMDENFHQRLALDEVGDEKIGEEIGGGDGNQAGEEDEHGEGVLEIHFIGVEVFGRAMNSLTR